MGVHAHGGARGGVHGRTHGGVHDVARGGARDVARGDAHGVAREVRGVSWEVRDAYSSLGARTAQRSQALGPSRSAAAIIPDGGQILKTSGVEMRGRYLR